MAERVGVENGKGPPDPRVKPEDGKMKIARAWNCDKIEMTGYWLAKSCHNSGGEIATPD